MLMLRCFCIFYGGYKATTSCSVIMTETEEQSLASLRYILAAPFYRKCLLGLGTGRLWHHFVLLPCQHTADGEVDELSSSWCQLCSIVER